MSEKQFPKKYSKKLDQFAQGYMETIDSAEAEEIKKMILSSERNLYEIEYEKDNNAKLLKMKEDLKDEVAPFTEARGTEVAKIKYAIHVCDQRNIKL